MTNTYTQPDLCIGDLSYNNECSKLDQNYIESLNAQVLEISGAPLNVYKLLGVHEQTQEINLISTNGRSIASGSLSGTLPMYAFENILLSWESDTMGATVTSGNTYIGWNFGTFKNSYGEEKYAPPQKLKKNVTRLKIKQGGIATNQATKIKIENSNDGGATWYRVDIITCSFSTDLVTYDIAQSFPANMWRLVPIEFSGTSSDTWIINTIELYDYVATAVTNIEDLFFLENRNKDYATNPIQLKVQYDVGETGTDFSRFGIDIPLQYVFTISFARMVALLSRPIVVGDIIELPNEMQYNTKLVGVKKWFEVTDTGWSANGYAPNWQPILYRFTAEPLIANTGNRDVIGFTKNTINSSDSDFIFESSQVVNIQNTSSENIAADASQAVPETGTDVSDMVYSDGLSTDPNPLPHTYNSTANYVEDGIPPNGLPYTEGSDFPNAPLDGSYHRLTYPGDTRIPTRLFKFSVVKGRWIFQETDRRSEYSSHKKAMLDIMKSNDRVDF